MKERCCHECLHAKLPAISCPPLAGLWTSVRRMGPRAWRIMASSACRIAIRRTPLDTHPQVLRSMGPRTMTPTSFFTSSLVPEAALKVQQGNNRGLGGIVLTALVFCYHVGVVETGEFFCSSPRSHSVHRSIFEVESKEVPGTHDPEAECMANSTHARLLQNLAASAKAQCRDR